MYDFIIVGAGSAGCVLADRLTADRSRRVLLLEAGAHPRSLAIRIPLATYRHLGGPYDWALETTPQSGANGRSIYWPRGRALGGSSAINAMIYLRGSRVDFDSWRDDYGCTGWGADDLLPFFERAESKLSIAPLRYTHPLNQAFSAAAQRCGYRCVAALNEATPGCVGAFHLTQRRGRRWSPADAYLRPAQRRTNLTVESRALVTRILLKHGRAVGVEYVKNGRTHRALADGEIVLAAGAVHTPHLLLLSGIGPAAHLGQRGVPVAVDSPSVGAGLQDHPMLVTAWEMPNVRNLWEEANLRNLLRWLLTGRGPLSAPGAQNCVYARSRPDAAAPDLQIGCIASPIVDHGLGRATTRGMTGIVTAVHVHSRGSVALRSANPHEKPLIDAGYLTDDRDLATLQAGIAELREIAAQPPLSTLIGPETSPGPTAALQPWIRANVGTMHHPTSSCAMGSAETNVCDPTLRVRGVDHLRIVDASVMPATPRGPTNAPTIAIAERAASILRQT